MKLPLDSVAAAVGSGLFASGREASYNLAAR
jgi:hypothetical protein